MLLGSSTLHQISTAVGPAEGSAGGPVCLSILLKETAGSAVVPPASGEDEVQQDMSNLEHTDGARSGQEALQGELRPADMLVQVPTKVPSLAHACHICLSSPTKDFD